MTSTALELPTARRRHYSTGKARKQWVCYVCHRAIAPGEICTYSYEPGGVNQYRECSSCRPVQLPKAVSR